MKQNELPLLYSTDIVLTGLKAHALFFVFMHSLCRQIEGKVVEISRLQEIFAEKVLQQVRCLFIILLT